MVVVGGTPYFLTSVVYAGIDFIRINSVDVVGQNFDLEFFMWFRWVGDNIDTSKIVGGYWGWMPSRDTGAVGGHMVKRMIEAAERSLIEQSAANVKAGFTTGLQGQ